MIKISVYWGLCITVPLLMESTKAHETEAAVEPVSGLHPHPKSSTLNPEQTFGSFRTHLITWNSLFKLPLQGSNPHQPVLRPPNRYGNSKDVSLAIGRQYIMVPHIQATTPPEAFPLLRPDM